MIALLIYNDLAYLKVILLTLKHMDLFASVFDCKVQISHENSSANCFNKTEAWSADFKVHCNVFDYLASCMFIVYNLLFLIKVLLILVKLGYNSKIGVK